MLIAFLDLLGFSEYTRSDLTAAMGLLENQRGVLDDKLQEARIHPAEVYNDRGLAALAQAHSVDSFHDLLPFSDSLFITSLVPDLFAHQLSHFLAECFLLVGHAYADADNEDHPEEVQMRDLITARPTETVHWYPPLWQGGICAGEVCTVQARGILAAQPFTVPNLAGEAVVRSVGLHKTAKGPRLYCDDSFTTLVSNDVRAFIQPVPNTAASELLWPAFQYVNRNNPTAEFCQFLDLWRPAVGLWKAKRADRAFEHYDAFLRLLIQSLISWGKHAGAEIDARDYAKAKVREYIGEDLVKDYVNG